MKYLNINSFRFSHVLFVCAVCLCSRWMLGGDFGGQREESEPLKLHIVVNHHAGAGNLT